jgi:hypothetical protein
MATTPRKTFPELQALSAPVVDSDVVAVYRAPGPAKRTTANTVRTYMQANLAETTGAGLIGTTRSGTAQAAFNLLGAPPAVLSEKFYLTNELTAAEITDIATQAGLIDVSAKLNALIATANGREVYLPQGGRVRCDSTISLVTSSANSFVPGLKLFGTGWDSTMLDSRVANGPAIQVDTTTGFKFQRGIILDGFEVTGAYGTPTTCDGFELRRAYDVTTGDVYFNNLRRGIYNKVGTNDEDSSNNFYITNQTRFNNCRKWAFDHDPAAGQNDTSLLIWEAVVVGCGTKEWQAITAVSIGATTTITFATHDFIVGDKVIVLGITGGPVLLNEIQATITAVTATTITFAVDSTAYGAWTAGGIVMRAEPNSGAVKWKGQLGQFRGGGITETQNVGLLIPYGGGGVSFKTDVNNFVIENVVGVSCIVNGSDGFSMRNADLRANQALVGPNYSHVLLNATEGAIKGVEIDRPTLIHFNGTNAWHRGITAITGAGGPSDVVISGVIEKDYDTSVATRKVFGDPLYGSTGLRVVKDAKVAITVPSVDKQTYTASNPAFTPDIRTASGGQVVLSTGASGTLTVNDFEEGLLPGLARAGFSYTLAIINNSGGTINLSFGMATTNAPTTIANGVQLVGRWIYDSSVGWFQSGSWYNVAAGETGTGALVRATSPTLTTPALGTPSAIVLTNATGFPGNVGAIQGLTSAANKVPYFTGAGTAAVADYEMVTANTSFTPVLAGSSGGTPTASTNTCSYLRNGSIVDVAIQISAITLNGATGNMTLTMPFTANGPRVFVLEEYLAVGFSVAGFMSNGSNIMTLKKLSDNSNVLVAGYGFRGGGSYRV